MVQRYSTTDLNHLAFIKQVVIPQRSAPAKDSTTDDTKDVAYWSRVLVVPSRSRQVSRLWLEKALVLTDGVQLFALMWQ
ncbi:hypothetical protein JG687_00001930, partial [Phytophthora cactorum]